VSGVGSAIDAASARFGPSVRGPIHLSHTMCVRVDAWYSLTTAVSYRMPEYCVPPSHCGTNSPVWMNGSHPTGKLLYCYLINFNLQYIRTKKQNNWTASTYATGQWTGYQKVAIIALTFASHRIFYFFYLAAFKRHYALRLAIAPEFFYCSYMCLFYVCSLGRWNKICKNTYVLQIDNWVGKSISCSDWMG